MKTSFEIYESVGFLINLKDGNDVLTLSGYSANGSYNSEANGKITCSVQTVGMDSDEYATDANGTSCDHLPTFANGTVYSQAVITVAYGFSTVGEYVATVWYSKTSGGSLTTRAIKRIPFTVVNNTPVAEPN